MTIRPAAPRRRQPAVGSLPIVTFVVPAISRKGAKNQLRRERGVPALPPCLRNGRRTEEPAWAQYWRVLVVAAPTKADILSPGAARPNHDAPHWPGRFFSLTLRLSQLSKFTSRPTSRSSMR